MKSISRTLALALGVTAIAIFVAALVLFMTMRLLNERDSQFCETATAVLADAAGDSPRLASLSDAGLAELERTSPNLWFSIATPQATFEFNRPARPATDLAIPYRGPMQSGIVSLPGSPSPLCIGSATTPSGERLSMLVTGAQPGALLSIRKFIEDELPILSLIGAAFAAVVAAGVLLAARFVENSIDRVSRMAMAIDPAAPQGSIPLSDVPRELQTLATSLNAAFDQIASFMERQRRFLGNVAHELRTPLAILRAKLDDLPDGRLKSALVLDVRRLTSLVVAMLELARLNQNGIEKAAVDLAGLTRDVLADFGPLALSQNIELSLVADREGPVRIVASEAAVRSAVANLVGNALVHAKGARNIVARLDHRGSVSICDDGPAAPTKPRPPVATPAGLAEWHAGAGLGLAIVEEIMAAHHGRLDVQSTAEGTTARLIFPAS